LTKSVILATKLISTRYLGIDTDSDSQDLSLILDWIQDFLFDSMITFLLVLLKKVIN